MRIDQIKHTWRPWQEGKDNTDANIDIPLSSVISESQEVPVMARALKTKDEEFGPAMSLEEALRWLRK